MIETQLNMFDTVVLVVVGLSMLISLFRGFLKEFFSLFAWFAAGLVTLYGFEHVRSFLEPYFTNKYVAAGLASIGTYITVFIAISILNSVIIQYLKSGAEVGFLDKILGLAFGFARGALIVSLAYLIMSNFWSEGNEPDWVKTAKTREYVEQGSQLLAKVAPEYIDGLKKHSDDAQQAVSNGIDDAGRSIGNATRDAKDALGNVKNDIQNQLNDGARNVKNGIGDLKNSIPK